MLASVSRRLTDTIFIFCDVVVVDDGGDDDDDDDDDDDCGDESRSPHQRVMLTDAGIRFSPADRREFYFLRCCCCCC